MKIYLFIVMSFFTIQIAKAQTASDYYLPLCEGNYLKFYTPDGGGGGWEARTTFHSIVHTDSINGEVFYLQKGYELMDFNPTDTLIFHCFWLRKDVNGDIIIGAYNLNGNETIDSATIVPPGAVFFSNQLLTLGFSQTQSGGTVTLTDSVVSISATVGTYKNCIQIRHTRKTNNIIDMMEDKYYAYHMGMIKEERFVPTDQIHVNSIVDFKVENCYSTGILNDYENKQKLTIYPNPAVDIITIYYNQIQKDVYNMNIRNFLGELVMSEIVKDGNHKVNIEGLNNGIYLLELKSNGISSIQKLVIKK